MGLLLDLYDPIWGGGAPPVVPSPTPGLPATIDLGGGSPPVEWLSDSAVAMPPTTAELDLGQNPVDLATAWQASPSVEMDGGGGF